MNHRLRRDPEPFTHRLATEPDDPLQLVAAERAEPAAQFPTIAGQHTHRFAATKTALHGLDPHRQQRGSLIQQGVLGPGIDVQRSLGQQGVGEPALAIGQGTGAGVEHGAQGRTGQQGLQNGRIPAIGQAHGDAAGGGDPRRCQLGGHPAGAPLTTTAGHAAQPLKFNQITDLGNGLRLGIAAGIPGIQAVHVGEQDQLVGPDRHRHQGGQGVVIPEAQFIGGQGVVFVDDRHHTPAEQLLDGAGGVAIAPARGQITPCEQHLGHGESMDAEGLLVEGHQPTLTHGGGGLQRHQLRGSPGEAQVFGAQPHRTAGHQGNGIAPPLLATEAGGQVGDHRGRGTALAAPQQAGSHLDHPAVGNGAGHQPSAVPTQRAIRSSRL